MLAPNTRRLYWKGYIDVRLEKLDIATDFAVPAALASQLVAGAPRGQKVAGTDGVFTVQVAQNHVAVLYVDGKVQGCSRPDRTRSGATTATCEWRLSTFACRWSRSPARKS